MTLLTKEGVYRGDFYLIDSRVSRDLH